MIFLLTCGLHFVPRENIRCKPRFSLKSRLSSSIKGHVIFLINFYHLLQSILTTLAHFNESLIFVQKSDFDKIANHNRTLMPTKSPKYNNGILMPPNIIKIGSFMKSLEFWTKYWFLKQCVQVQLWIIFHKKFRRFGNNQ